MGADVAEGKSNSRGKPDWSNAKVLDWRTGDHVATVHCRLPDDEYAKVLVQVSKDYNEAYVAVERNGPGLAVIRSMQAHNYKNFYYHESDDPRKGRSSHIGWLTTSASKPSMLNDLAVAIKAQEFTSPDAGFWDEARSLGRDGKALGSAHDDQVMSAAIAEQARRAYRPGQRRAPEGKGQQVGNRLFSWPRWTGAR